MSLLIWRVYGLAAPHHIQVYYIYVQKVSTIKYDESPSPQPPNTQKKEKKKKRKIKSQMNKLKKIN